MPTRRGEVAGGGDVYHAQTGKKKHCRAYRARPSDAGGF